MLKHNWSLTCRSTKSGLILIVVLATVLGSSSCSNPPNRYAGPPDAITVGYQLHVGSTLIHIAEDQGFFSANGLTVAFREYESGAQAINGLSRNEVDLGVAAEFVFVQYVMGDQEMQALASISLIDNIWVVARNDRAIRTPADLKGKRIGIRPQASGRFYFGRFLELYGVSVKQVDIVDVTAADFVNVIVNGDVDAVVTYQPYIDQVKNQLGEGTLVWSIQNNQPGYSLVLSTRAWMERKPEVGNRFFQSLAQAEEFYVLHPDQARAIVQKKMKYDDATMAAQWSGNEFSLSLDQSLILALEDEARWLIDNQMTQVQQVPDFLNFIDWEGLAAIKPEAVNIIR